MIRPRFFLGSTALATLWYLCMARTHMQIAVHALEAFSISAGVKYEVPANIVLAVAEKEGGRPGQWVRNTNGTHDVGPMQFNTTYLRELERFGITANDVAAKGCYAFDLAAGRQLPWPVAGSEA